MNPAGTARAPWPARLALLAIYERSRDWAQASDIAQRMQASSQGDFSTRQAHYLCEQALALAAGGDLPAAQALLERAVATAPQAARARVVDRPRAPRIVSPDHRRAVLRNHFIKQPHLRGKIGFHVGVIVEVIA